MKGAGLLLLGVSGLLAGDPAAPPAGEPRPAPSDPKQAAPDLRPETALDRIRKRNLFHPTRGVLSKPGDALAAGKPLPRLVGTLVTPKRHSALLRWSEKEDARVVAEGDEVEGYKVKKIAQNRVQLVDLKGGEARWVELEPEGTAADLPGGELGALFDLSKKISVPPQPAKPIANAPLAPAPGSRP